MYKIKQIRITKDHSFYKECNRICLIMKEIYNQALYIQRQHYVEKKPYIGFFDMVKRMQSLDIYKKFNTKVAKKVLKRLDENYKSFFVLKKSKSIKFPKPPTYLDQKNGRFIAEFDMESISKKPKFINSNILKLTSCDIEIHVPDLEISKVVSVRIIPKSYKKKCHFFKIEVVYKVEENTIKDIKEIEKPKILGIDLGVKNLATVANNYNNESFIINGKPLVYLFSIYEKLFSKRPKSYSRMLRRKEDRINSYIHKASRMLADYAMSQGIDHVVVGYNKDWKQGATLGKKNNQIFQKIPFRKLINQLKYKLEDFGIGLTEINEAYTSKCSFLDNEPVQKHDNYKGKRLKRGLFITYENHRINADLNGAYNIIRKFDKTFGFDKNVFPDLNWNGIGGRIRSPITKIYSFC